MKFPSKQQFVEFATFYGNQFSFDDFGHFYDTLHTLYREDEPSEEVMWEVHVVTVIPRLATDEEIHAIVVLAKQETLVAYGDMYLFGLFQIIVSNLRDNQFQFTMPQIIKAVHKQINPLITDFMVRYYMNPLVVFTGKKIDKTFIKILE